MRGLFVCLNIDGDFACLNVIEPEPLPELVFEPEHEDAVEEGLLPILTNEHRVEMNRRYGHYLTPLEDSDASD